MSRTTPRIHNNIMVCRDASITIGTPEWYAWLQSAATFYFSSVQGTFTACREHVQRGGSYWRAYRSGSGKVHRAYLGKGEDLTVDRLKKVAVALTERVAASTLTFGETGEADASLMGLSVTHSGSAGLQNAGGSVSDAPFDSLILTKISPPPALTGRVTRSRLMERLTGGLRRKLTLISAPAGSGKSTLLSQWVSISGCPTAWVSLNAGENDPVRFWSYVIAAIQVVRPDVGDVAMALLRSSHSPRLTSVLTTLINALATMQSDLTLVLDDYHVIQTQTVHDDVDFLLDLLPPRVHLVIASRTDPPLPLSRLRARGQITELRLTDLTFTLDEAAAFLNEVMGLSLSDEEVSALMNSTEGWIAGLQMAALTLPGIGDVGKFAETFAGDHEYILDYLMEEVFASQPEGMRSFLLRTSVLHRLCGPLCDFVTGSSGGQAMLEKLQRANLFVVPLDHERHWYRYHHLFADFLRACVGRSQPDLLPELHRRASGWFAANDFIAEAVGHALEAKDFESAAHLVDRSAWAMLRRGEAVTFQQWIGRLPDDIVRSQPRLCLYHAWVLAMSGHQDAAEERLLDIERYLDNKSGDAAGTAMEPPDAGLAFSERLLDEVAVIRALLAFGRDDRHCDLVGSLQTIRQLPRDDPLRGLAALNVAMAYWQSGDVARSVAAFAQVGDYSQRVGNSVNAIGALNHLAGIQVIQGNLVQAVRTYQQAIDLAKEPRNYPGAITGAPYVGLGQLLYERNDLSSAVLYADQGLERVRPWAATEFQFRGYEVLARVKQARGDIEGALSTIDEAEQIALSQDMARRFFRFSQYRVRLWLAQGNVEAAARWAQAAELTGDEQENYPCEGGHLTLARVMIAEGRPAEAIDLLERLLHAAETAERNGSVIKILALRALALEADGKTSEALASLARALQMGKPQGYVRTFIDYGAPMAALLTKLLHTPQKRRALLAHHVSRGYVSKLLAALNAEVLESLATNGDPRNDSQSLVDPLSERELQVLTLITTGLSNPEIADELIVAVSTIKKHINSIYGKLGVHRRSQAIARARELSLLQ